MARWLRGRSLLPGGDCADAAIGLDGDTIVEVRAPCAADPPAVDGLIVPGLVNAHTHVELSWAAGRVPGGEGLAAWVTALLRQGHPPDADAGIAALQALGTAIVSDVGNEGDTGAALAASGLSGVVHHEFLGLDRDAVCAMVLAVAGAWRDDRAPRGHVVTRPAPHAVHTTAPALLRACLEGRAAPRASIHVAEHADELALLRDGSGPFAALMDHLGRDWHWWRAPGLGPVEVLAELGLLGRVLAVHGVCLSAREIDLLAGSGTPLCLCPRSNLHVGGRLPDVPALIEAGVALCLGTDSLASSPDLDVLAEIPVLAEAFPEVPAGRWLELATSAGADALGVAGGRIAPGLAPGLVLLQGVHDPRDLTRAAPARRWLVPAGPMEVAHG